jgi:NitT/TauT family transport system substrate-binding protein
MPHLRQLTLAALVGLALVACGGAQEAATTGDATTDTPPAAVGTEAANDEPNASSAAEEAIPLRVGLLEFLPTFNIYVAEQEGYFEDEGLDVELVYMQDQNLVGQAVESGEVDLGSRNYDGILAAVAQGFEWRAIYPHVLYSSNSPDAQLMIREDLYTGTAEDAAKALENEPFAVNVGGQSWMSVQVYLENQWDVDPETIEFVDVAYSDMLAAFDQGTVAGAHVVEPFVAAIEEAGVAKSLGPHLDSVALLPPHGNGTERFVIQSSFARADWIEDNGEAVQRFVRAMDSATQAVLDDPEQFNDLAVEFTGLEEDVVLGGLYPEKYVVDTVITPDEARAPINFNYATGLIDRELELNEVVSDYFPLEQ